MFYKLLFSLLLLALKLILFIHHNMGLETKMSLEPKNIYEEIKDNSKLMIMIMICINGY